MVRVHSLEGGWVRSLMAELLWSELREATMTNSFSNSDGGGWCGILGVVERIRGEGCGKMELRAIRSF